MFVLVVSLCGTLLLAGRRAGYIIIFLGSVLGLVIPVIHMRGTRGVIGGEIGNSSEAFFFVWTLLALGITATFSIILSARALLSLPWRRSRRSWIEATFALSRWQKSSAAKELPGGCQKERQAARCHALTKMLGIDIYEIINLSPTGISRIAAK
jgi:hypothetical protein